ncbi:hypothetical protein PUN28_006102 [Cardiocondyla obscurior]|uniref:Uncharacterized protein n=1 Tax=Cardiocondyla obscurior TaxID=286306 RepID=A0AAW2G8U6_9HYME
MSHLCYLDFMTVDRCIFVQTSSKLVTVATTYTTDIFHVSCLRIACVMHLYNKFISKELTFLMLLYLYKKNFIHVKLYICLSKIEQVDSKNYVHLYIHIHIYVYIFTDSCVKIRLPERITPYVKKTPSQQKNG